MGALDRLTRLAVPAGYTAAALALAALVLFTAVVGGGTISEAATSATFYAPTLAALGSTIALLIALIALFARHAGAMNAFGVVAFFTALVGTVLGAGGYWSYVFTLPYLADQAPALADGSSGSVVVGFVVSFLIMGLGWLAFAAALLRDHAVARWAVILLMIGSVVTMVPMPSRTLVLAIAAACVAHSVSRKTAPDKTNRSMASA